MHHFVRSGKTKWERSALLETFNYKLCNFSEKIKFLVFTTTENYMFAAILKFHKRWIKYWTGTPVMTGVHLLCYPNGSVCLESLYADGCFCCGFCSCLLQNVCNYSISRPVSLFQKEYMYVFYEFIFVCVVGWGACLNCVGACLCVFAHRNEERFLYPYCKVGLKWFLE